MSGLAWDLPSPTNLSGDKLKRESQGNPHPNSSPIVQEMMLVASALETFVLQP